MCLSRNSSNINILGGGKMRGFPLLALSERLPVRLDGKVALSEEVVLTKLRSAMPRFEEYCRVFNANRSLNELIADMPLVAFRDFSFCELIRTRATCVLMMDKSVERMFSTSARHEFARKVESSIWRWGSRSVDDDWETFADAHNRIPEFDLGISGAQVRLDWTTGYNEIGFSKFARLFLDGVFAYIVYYKGEHVMTISFSIYAGKTLLVHSIQSPVKKGNRFLYKMGESRYEFVLAAFRRAFPDWRIMLADGASLSRFYFSQYTEYYRKLKNRVITKNEPSDLAEMEKYKKKLRDLIQGVRPRLMRAHNHLPSLGFLGTHKINRLKFNEVHI
jgi:hypothetical protein